MKRLTLQVLALLVFFSTAAGPAAAIEAYLVPPAEILKVKNMVDDPTPFYARTENFRKFMPQEAWEQVTYPIEEMKAAWEKVVGFRAPDVVGKIAPEIKPGRYTLADKERYPFKELMIPYHYKRWNDPGTQGLPRHIGYYTEIEVVPTRQCYHALPVAEATLKNMGKTQQDSQGYIIPETFQGGYPFPRPSGEHRAMQILYNWRKRKGDHDNMVIYDFSMGVNSSLKIDQQGMGFYYTLRTEGRVLAPPYGWLDERAQKQGEEIIHLFQTVTPQELYGNVYHVTMYVSPYKETNFLAYINFLRRIRKVTSTDSQDQIPGSDIAWDDTSGFSQDMRPDRYPYEYRVIEEREFLVPAYGSDNPDYLDTSDQFKWKGRKFERRPLWVVEMKQLDRNYVYSKRVAYMDQETLLGLLFEMYDQKGDYYRSIETTYVLVEPMGIYNGRDLNLNWIDTHSTLVYLPAYPALWLSREEMNIKNLIRAK